MNTDSEIYKICENLWNLWEEQSQDASVKIRGICGRIISRCRGWLPQISQMNTDIGCEGVSHRQHRGARILEYIKSVNICGICGRTISRCICENPWNLWENNLKMQRMAPTDIADEHGYRGRRSFPQIAQMNTDIGIYKICEICGICGRTISRCICENLCNQWENKSQAAEAISNRFQKITDAYKNQ